MSKETQPIHREPPAEQPHLTIAGSYKDPETNGLYVHKDLVEVVAPFAEEAHISPMQVHESFGDVESFVAYVQRYGMTATTHLTWNSRGLRAVLDYADSDDRAPGRCQWTATLPFVVSREWQTWMQFANGQARSQKEAVERLEDLAADIRKPSPADLMAILRTLRTTVNSQSETELRPDGTAKVEFARDSKLTGSVELPSLIQIAIPALKGHTDDDGRPVMYGLDVKLRASIDDNAKLTLRFTIPNAERVLEAVYEERVVAAKALLGDEFALLRASDNA